MHQLTGRLSALDPDAGAALRVISYFDELLDQRSGLESIVRGAAVLSGVPARLMTPSRSTALRVLPDGRRSDEPTPPLPEWPRKELPQSAVTLWLERSGETGPVEAMVLERATQAARTVLERTRGRYSPARRQDHELIELLLDEEASTSERAHAIRALGMRPGQVIQVVQAAGARPRIVPQGMPLPESSAGQQIAIGVPVLIEDAPTSARSASAALRLTAECAPGSPCTSVIRASELGATLLLVSGFDHVPQWQTHPDVIAITRASQELPWLLTTLHALSAASSLRAAATSLHVHHSTLQSRVERACKELGWDVTTAAGKFRLQVALTVRRLAAAESGRVLTGGAERSDVLQA